MCIHMHHVTYREMRPYGTKLSPPYLRIGTLECAAARASGYCSGPYCRRVRALLFYGMWKGWAPTASILWPRIGQILYVTCQRRHACMHACRVVRACVRAEGGLHMNRGGRIAPPYPCRPYNLYGLVRGLQFYGVGPPRLGLGL